VSTARARDRLGVILGLYGLRFLLAASFAVPIVSIVEGAGVSGFVDGDAILFAPSGLYLSELLRLAAPDLRAFAGNSLYLALPALVFAIFTRAALMAALAESGRLPLGAVFERALRALPGFLLISGLGVIARIVLFLVAFEVGGPALTLAELSFNEKNADLTALAAMLACLLPLLLIPPLADLTRARVLLDGARVRDAIAPAFRLFRAKFPAILLAWLLPTLAALAAGLVVAAVVPWLDVSKPGGGRLLGVFMLHQLVAFGLVWFDAVWLAKAVNFSRTSPAYTPARNAELRDPSSSPIASPDA
jgi:hypothetical protein